MEQDPTHGEAEIVYPVPEDESERLAFLNSCVLSFSPVEREFDELTRIAADIYGVPIALVTLIGKDLQWIHGRTGLSLDWSSRTTSFCAHTIVNDSPFIVRDASIDRRFANNPLVVGEPHIQFYAGAPITTRDGVRLGAVCIIDTVARPYFKKEDAKTLISLANLTARRLEARRGEVEGRAVGGFAEATALAILTSNSSGLITSWNRAAENMFGFSRDEAIGRPMDIIIPDRFQGGHRKSLEHVAAGGDTKLVGKTIEVVARRADDSEFPIEISIAAWPTVGGVAFGAHIQDISVRRLREAELEHTAAHDQLTGLQNPKAFRNEVQRRIDRSQSAGLLVLDLDGFKFVNDSLGHAVGDSLLQALAIRLRGIADSGWTIGRLGGDEFAILLPNGDLFAVREAAGAVLNILAKVFQVANHRFEVAP